MDLKSKYRPEHKVCMFIVFPAWMLLLINLLSAGVIMAQHKNTIFSYYTKDDGLSHNRVHCMIKDSKGFLWVGTWNGLNRFDGYDFTIFKRDKSALSISGNFIYALHEDHYGNIWIGTNNGLNTYLYDKNIVVTPCMLSGFQPSMDAIRANTMVQDTDRNLWIGTNKGIEVVQIVNPEGEIRHMSRYTLTDNGHQNSEGSVNILFVDNTGNIWSGTDNGLYIFDKQSDRFVLFNDPSRVVNPIYNNTVHSIYQDKNSLLWVGTFYGLYAINTESGDIFTYFHIPDNPNSIAHNVIHDITEDYFGNLIIGTLGGVSVFNEHTGNFVNYMASKNKNDGLNNIFTSCLLGDNQGNIWIGTESGGLNRYNIFQNQFSFFNKGNSVNGGLSHNTINSVYEDDQYIWIGTAGGGLNRYTTSTDTYHHYKVKHGYPGSLRNNFVTSITGASDGKLYIGTWGGGLHSLDQEHVEAGYFSHYLHQPGHNNTLPDNFISSFIEDEFGRMWIGSRDGLSLFDLSNGQINLFNKIVNGQIINDVGCLRFDASNNLWVGTTHGLFKILADSEGKIHIEDSEVNFFTYDASDPHSIAGNFITYIHRDSNGNMWFGTYGNGVSLLEASSVNCNKDRFLHYSTIDGLANDVVFGILDDNQNNIWISTDFGLSQFDPVKEHFINYYTSDGLINNQYYWSASYKNTEGILYFGGTNGLNAFFPDSIIRHAVNPNIVMCELTINNRPVSIGKKYHGNVLLNQSILSTDEITISYKVKEFTIGFSALLFDQSDKVQYAYTLDGFDREWTYVDASRRYASFMNLPGGNYTLIVKATDSQNNWHTEHVALKIQVIPPFYTRLWFISLMILVLGASVITYNRIRLYVARRQKQLLEEKVRIRTLQLEAKKDKLLAQTNYLNETLIQLENQKLQIKEQRQYIECKDREFLNRAVHIINQNISNPSLNVKMLAMEMFVSRSLLHKKLTAISGLSANELITSIRLKRSASLLQLGQGNIAEVAFDIGFNDPKYFSRCFKKFFKVSPSEYLNRQITARGDNGASGNYEPYPMNAFEA